jgi:hypothetical protein
MDLRPCRDRLSPSRRPADSSCPIAGTSDCRAWAIGGPWLSRFKFKPIPGTAYPNCRAHQMCGIHSCAGRDRLSSRITSACVSWQRWCIVSPQYWCLQAVPDIVGRCWVPSKNASGSLAGESGGAVPALQAQDQVASQVPRSIPFLPGSRAAAELQATRAIISFIFWILGDHLHEQVRD